MFFKSKTPSEQQPARDASSQDAQRGAAHSSLPLEERKRRADYSHVVMQAFGAIVAVFMRSKPHSQMRLADIERIVAPAVTRGQFSLAEISHEQSGLSISRPDRRCALGPGFTGNRRADFLRDLEQPLNLAPREWNSGDVVWIMEAIGASTCDQ